MARKKIFTRLELLHGKGSPAEMVQSVGELFLPLKKSRSRRKSERNAIGLREFPLTPEKTSVFFDHISNDSKQKAKKILSEYKNARITSEWTRGYLTALGGMVNSLDSSRSHIPFLIKVREKDEKNIRAVRNEFAERIDKPFTCEYDRGFLTAWVQYLSILLLYK